MRSPSRARQPGGQITPSPPAAPFGPWSRQPWARFWPRRASAVQPASPGSKQSCSHPLRPTIRFLHAARSSISRPLTSSLCPSGGAVLRRSCPRNRMRVVPSMTCERVPTLPVYSCPTSSSPIAGDLHECCRRRPTESRAPSTKLPQVHCRRPPRALRWQQPAARWRSVYGAQARRLIPVR